MRRWRSPCPNARTGPGWELLLDTNAPEREAAAAFGIGDVHAVVGRSLLMFALIPARAGLRTARGAEA